MKNRPYNRPMLAYQTSGKGAPVVLLHAFPLSSAMWEYQIPVLNREFQVIVPDLSGFGRSAGCPDVTMESMAREVEELLTRLKIPEPVMMAGLSMGGYVAFEFLRHFPKKLRGLAFFATRATADTPAARENRIKSIEAMEHFGLEPFAKKAVKSQLGKTTQEKNPELIAHVLKLMTANKAEAAIAAQHAMAARRDSSDLLSSVDLPVLIAAGEEDILSPPEEMRSLHEQIRASQFHVIPQCGHLLNLEQPETFQAIFRNFLKSF